MAVLVILPQTVAIAYSAQLQPLVVATVALGINRLQAIQEEVAVVEPIHQLTAVDYECLAALELLDKDFREVLVYVLMTTVKTHTTVVVVVVPAALVGPAKTKINNRQHMVDREQPVIF
jgi:hypothetical protein